MVSSDGRLQRAAGAAHAKASSSEEFALEMSRAQAGQALKLKNETTLGPQEVEEWLDFFNRKKG